MSGKSILTLGILLTGLLSSTVLLAGTYKWVDKDGNVVYSQHPPPSGQFESIRVRPKPRSATSANSAAEQSKQFLENATSQRKSDNKLKGELKKAQELRKKNCATARQQLQFYTVYRRKKNDKGEYVRVTDKEREAGLKEAKQAVKEFCD